VGILDSFKSARAEIDKARAEVGTRRAAKPAATGKVVEFGGKVALHPLHTAGPGTVQVNGTHVIFTRKSSVTRIALDDVTRVEVYSVGRSFRLVVWGSALGSQGVFQGPSDQVNALRSAVGF
jgi:hypothetical protein